MKGSFTVRHIDGFAATDRLSIIESLEKRAFRCRRSNNSLQHPICKIAEQSTTHEAENGMIGGRGKKREGERERTRLERGNKTGSRYRVYAMRKSHNYILIGFFFISIYFLYLFNPIKFFFISFFFYLILFFYKKLLN